MQNKDILERSFLDRFRYAYQFFPDGTISKGEPGKEPDFIVVSPNQRIGIEMARLFRDDGRDQFGLRPQAQLQNRILNEAMEKFINSTGHRYRVVLGFQERSGIVPKRIKEISNFLAGVIARAVALRPPSYANPTMIGLSDLHPFEGVFALVQIYDFSDVFDYTWSIQNVFSVDPLNESVLNARVREKEAKRSKGLYSGIDKIWLLLYMDFFDHAMDQQIPKKISIELCPHGFDKIVIFKTLEDTCLVIYPEFACS